jgi:DNA gyrase subunit A
MTTKTEDFVRHLFVTSTYHFLQFFTNKGKVYHLKVYEVPEAGRQAKGTALINLISLEAGEKITAIIPVRSFQKDLFLFMLTKKGIVKKTNLELFKTSRKDGIIAINLDKDDELKEVLLTDGNSDILLGTKEGLIIRFNEKDVSPHGRASRGVKGINLRENDEVIGADVVREQVDVLTITENGYGKRTPVSEYRLQSRGGKGIINIKLTLKSGPVIGLQLIKKNEEVMLISREGVIIRLNADEISTMGRSTQGVKIMRPDENDKVVAIAKISDDSCFS